MAPTASGEANLVSKILSVVQGAFALLDSLEVLLWNKESTTLVIWDGKSTNRI